MPSTKRKLSTTRSAEITLIELRRRIDAMVGLYKWIQQDQEKKDDEWFSVLIGGEYIATHALFGRMSREKAISASRMVADHLYDFLSTPAPKLKEPEPTI